MIKEFIYIVRCTYPSSWTYSGEETVNISYWLKEEDAKLHCKKLEKSKGDCQYEVEKEYLNCE